MRRLGLRLEILLTILFITAVAMFLIGIIAFKVSERLALQGKVEGVKSVISAFETLYMQSQDKNNGIDFLKKTLEPGAWGIIASREERTLFRTETAQHTGNLQDPIILDVVRTGKTAVKVDGINFPPFTFYRGFKIASPIGDKNEVILLYQPLVSLEQSILLGQKMISLWIILFLIVIGALGYYILSRRVVTPVQNLIRTTEKIAGGKFLYGIDVGNVDEINRLYSALRNMYEEIEESKSKLRSNIKTLEETNRELIQTQSELVASEKFASLGKLSAGVAHEIGNPLSAIRSYVDVLRRGSALNEEKKGTILLNIQHETERIDRIIRTLLDYSRPKDFKPRKLRVNDIIRQTVEIVNSQGLLKETVLTLDLRDEIPQIEADSHQLSQVIINLILNSKDALDGGGKIEISTSETEKGESRIEVSDNGAGITDEIVDKIFDPFFTTKEPGMGTGLGLSVSERIVKAFGGTISVESKQDKGTTFRITFPGDKHHKHVKGLGN